MYDMGYHRVGCIGCPLATYRQKMKEFADFPTYKDHYIKAFDEMVKVRKNEGKDNVEKYGNKWATGKDVYEWWIEKDKHITKGQMTINDYLQTDEFGLIVRKPKKGDST